MHSIFKQLKQRFFLWVAGAKSTTIHELLAHTPMQPAEIFDDVTGAVKFIEQGHPHDALVYTPSGFVPIKHLHKTVPYARWVIALDDGRTLACADTHVVIRGCGAETFVRDLVVGDLIDTTSGPKAVTSILETSDLVDMYDLELDDHHHVFYTNGILSHNSETTCAYLFWFAIFNEDKTILITSNKHKNALEMISRIKYMYEHLPDFLKPGVTEDGWNKLSLMFETGSRMISDATSDSTGRGGSFSILFCLSGENTVTVRNKGTGLVEDIPIETLYTTLGGDVEHDFGRNDEYEILTPTGWQEFRGVLATGKKQVITIRTEDGEITCTPEHVLFSNGMQRVAGSLTTGDTIDTTAGQTRVTDIRHSETEVATYDIVEVSDVEHRFVVNKTFLTKNCDETAFVRPSIQQEFWASISPTLATGGKLFMTSTPNGDSDLFATLWRGAISGTNGFFPMTIKWNEVPGRDKNFKATEIAKNGILKWEQEYECTQGDKTVKVLDEFGNIIEISLENLYLLLAQQLPPAHHSD